MICHWTEHQAGDGAHYARIDTSCGRHWGIDKGREMLAASINCPDCDNPVKLGGERPANACTSAVRMHKPTERKPMTVAEAIAAGDYEWKMSESVRIASETRTALLGVSECPVPKGCQGPYLAYYAPDFATYSGQTFGTIACRFLHHGCSWSVREAKRKQAEAEAAAKRGAK